MADWSEFELARALKMRSQGKTYQEIADTLGRTERAVAARFSRHAEATGQYHYGAETVWRCKQLLISDYGIEETAAIIGCPIEVAMAALEA